MGAALQQMEISPRTNAVLSSIREELESAWGPEGAPPTPSSMGAAAGSGGAANPAETSDTLDLFLAEIADLAAIQYDLDDAAASSLIYDLADEMGMPIPDTGAAPEEVAAWLGRAKSMQFPQAVLHRAQEQATAGAGAP
jgi:hypothetical protein